MDIIAKDIESTRGIYNCIYMYVNSLRRLYYVGHTIDLYKRHKQHLHCPSTRFDRHLKAHIDEWFIYVLYKDLDESCLANWEQLFIDLMFDSKGNRQPYSLNLSPMASGGASRNPEIAAMFTGDKNPRWGKPGTMLGKTQTPEARKRMSISKKGKKQHIKTRQALQTAVKGIPKSKEHREKLSKANKGKPLTLERRLNISKAVRKYLELKRQVILGDSVT